MTRRPALVAAGSVAFLIAVAGVAGIAGLTHRAPPPAAAQQARADGVPDVPLARAVYGTYVARIHAHGRVGAPAGGEAKLVFAGTGIVARIDVRVGQSVAAGEPLAALDTSGLALELEQARGDASAVTAAYGGGGVPTQALQGAKARLTAARDRLGALADGTASVQSDRVAAFAAVRQSASKMLGDERALERQTALYAGGVSALKDVEAARRQLSFDRADAEANRAKATGTGSTVSSTIAQARADLAHSESDVRAARAQVAVSGAQAAAAQARVGAARRTLALATLRAPSAGIVTAIFKHPGEAVDPTQPALMIGPPTTSTETLAVGAPDARDVRPGQPVQSCIAGRTGTGTGSVVGTVPSVDPATQATTIVVAGIPPGGVPGDAVEATIAVGVRHGIVIPTSAIVEDPQTGKSLVFVRERRADGGEAFVPHEIAVADGDEERSLIARGLRGGERIAVQGAFDLLAPAGGG